MRVMARPEVRPAAHDVRRNPLTCVLMTAALAATFWIGVFWLAQRVV
jgi:hypothetical protein